MIPSEATPTPAPLTPARIAALRRLEGVATPGATQPDWWCQDCEIAVDGRDVTSAERHDERAEGCGLRVVPYSQHMRAALADALIESAPALLAAAERVGEVESRMVGLRPTVRRFAEAMEQKLRENQHKGGWDDCRPLDLLKRLFEEADELEGAIRDHGEEWNGHVVAREAADVANFAMMIADVCGGIKAAAEQAAKAREGGR